MLDSETKRKIDSLRQILVGKVPDPKAQVEQITTALIYKFMDDMDKDAEEANGKATFFSGDFAQYSWSKLLDPKLGGHDRLNLYVEAITSMSRNSNIPQLFRDIFKDAFLPYRDPSTLNMFLKEANEFNYSDSESLGDAYEYLLSIMSSQGDAGQFRTPRHIIDFIVKVVDPKKDETILDPACGTAGFLISAFKHILSQHDGVDDPDNKEKSLTPDERKKLMNNVVGYDISPDMVRISLVNLYLHGFPEPKIFEYDTLSSEEKWDETYDCIMANPPFMTPKGGIRPHKRFSVQANRAEVLFVDYIVEHLKLNGRAGIIVPEGIIFQSANAYKALRKKLVEDGLFAVISLPAGVFNPYSGVKTSILFFDNQLAKKSKDILFIKIDSDGFDLGAQRKKIEKNDLTEALEIIKKYQSTTVIPAPNIVIPAQAGIQTLAISKDKIALSGDYNLSADRYRETVDLKTQKWPMVELGEVCDLYNGSTPLRSDNSYWENGTISWFTIDDIRNQGRQIKRTAQKITQKALEKTSVRLLPPKTVLLCCTASIGEYAITEIETTTNQQFNGLVIKKEYSEKLLPIFLFHLASTFKKELVRLSGKTSFNFVSVGTLKHIKIPLPPLEIQKQIVEEIEGYQKIIDGAKQVISSWKPKIDIDSEWEKVKLGDVSSLMTGGTPLTLKREYYGGDIKWLVSGDINKGEIFDCEGRITEMALKESNARLLPINSVLIALNGQGKTRGTVALLKTEAACNQSLVSINPNRDKLVPEFLLFILKAKYQEIRNINGENQRGGLNMPIIRQIAIPLPPLAIQKQIVEKIEGEQKIVEGNNRLVEIYERKIEEVIEKI